MRLLQILILKYLDEEPNEPVSSTRIRESLQSTGFTVGQDQVHYSLKKLQEDGFLDFADKRYMIKDKGQRFMYQLRMFLGGDLADLDYVKDALLLR